MASTLLWAVPPPIGVVTARGSFRLDDSTVTGNATLFEGSTVEAGGVATLRLGSGAEISLLSGSKGRIFGDHLTLERGSGEFARAPGFHMEARTLRIHPETGQARARVTLESGNRVEVAALEGSFRVLNARGLLVADLAPGTALAFEPLPQGGAGEPWRMSGCLRVENGHFLLTDETTSVTAELTGSSLAAEEGNRVRIDGIMDSSLTPVSGTTQVLKVTQLRRLGKGCAAGKGDKGAAAAGAGGAAGKAGGGGSHAGIAASTIAIIGGVAAAGAVAGLAASDALPGQGGGRTVSR